MLLLLLLLLLHSTGITSSGSSNTMWAATILLQLHQLCVQPVMTLQVWQDITQLSWAVNPTISRLFPYQPAQYAPCVIVRRRYHDQRASWFTAGSTVCGTLFSATATAAVDAVAAVAAGGSGAIATEQLMQCLCADAVYPRWHFDPSAQLLLLLLLVLLWSCQL
jgi:hypothetical protein